MPRETQPGAGHRTGREPAPRKDETEGKTGIERMLAATQRLTKLLDDPQPGLFAWQEALGAQLDELAAFSPSRRELVAFVEDVGSHARGDCPSVGWEHIAKALGNRARALLARVTS